MHPVLAAVATVATNARNASSTMQILGVNSIPDAIEKIGGMDRNLAMPLSDFIRMLAGDQVGEFVRELLMTDATEEALRPHVAEYLTEVTGENVGRADPAVLKAFFNRYADPSDALRIALIEREDYMDYIHPLDEQLCYAQVQRLSRALGHQTTLALLDMLQWDVQHLGKARIWLQSSNASRRPAIDANLPSHGVKSLLNTLIDEGVLKDSPFRPVGASSSPSFFPRKVKNGS